MTVGLLFTIHAVIALINGLVFLVVPELYLSIFGVTVAGPDTAFLGRLFAAALLSYGLVAWFARSAGPSAARRAILIGFAIPIAIGFVLTLIAQLSGLMNVLGWALVVLYLTMGVGYSYFALNEPRYTEVRGHSEEPLEEFGNAA
ncbi:MAG: hypothetical protein KDH89_12030 [Anaerolineae bacterium]|nr:hypothetical protein [Anaerolineae bacterium]